MEKKYKNYKAKKKNNQIMQEDLFLKGSKAQKLISQHNLQNFHKEEALLQIRC